MTSANRHWPSLFKSKPCGNRHQGNHDMNSSSLMSTSCQRSSLLSEERNPDPKPRWNPKPEQIRILEAIFNSGMVNPPRDEIRRIRNQLQEYGQVGDANVFYWFQNRKSRSKQKQRHHHATRPPLCRSSNATAVATQPAAPPATSSSSSSSEKSTNSEKSLVQEKTILSHLSAVEPFFSAMVDFPGLCSELLAELTNQETLKAAHTVPTTTVTTTAAAVSSGSTVGGHVDDIIQGACTAVRLTVFINGVAFEVEAGLLNVTAAFGYGAMLLNSSGVPVRVDERGITLLPLQHGASYYLI
ncbi:WUSCHEL-related homeobox 8-like [Wolffia australiana]